MSPADTASGASALPLVTIVTPAYNQAEYLAETIDSVLAQDYPNIEYIVIDDGSTDRTREVLHRYDGRICWESQENMGQAATLNKGWSMGAGQIIGYLSSDDLLILDAVSQSVRYLVDHPQATLVYPDFALIDAKGQFMRTVRTPDYSYFDLAVNLVCQPGPGAFFWKKYFDRIGGWNTQLHQIPDFEYWLRLSRQGEFVRIPMVLALSRVHEGSQSFKATSLQRSMEPVKVVNEYFNRQAASSLKGFGHKARGKAHLLSARLFFRSGRWLPGSVQVWEALVLAPSLMLSRAFWAILRNSFSVKLLSRVFFNTGR